MRTISQPTRDELHRLAQIDASVSIVSQVIIDCTRIGLSPADADVTDHHFARSAPLIGEGRIGE